MLGEYGHFRKWFTNRSTTVAVATSDTGPITLITARSANHKTYVQRIIVSPTTYAAKTWTFVDTNSSPLTIGIVGIPASAPTTPGLADYILDFGPEGIPLSLGKDLTITLTASGAAAQVRVEAYEKLGAAVAIATTN